MLGLSLLDRFAYAVLVLALMGTCVVVVGPHHNVALLISDIDAPEEIDRSERLPVVVTVLARGCQHFGALIVSRTLENATIAAHGFDTSEPGINCPDVLKYTERAIVLEPPFADPFTVIARQPDGSPITEVVRIR